MILKVISNVEPVKSFNAKLQVKTLILYLKVLRIGTRWNACGDKRELPVMISGFPTLSEF